MSLAQEATDSNNYFWPRPSAVSSGPNGAVAKNEGLTFADDTAASSRDVVFFELKDVSIDAM